MLILFNQKTYNLLLGTHEMDGSEVDHLQSAMYFFSSRFPDKTDFEIEYGPKGRLQPGVVARNVREGAVEMRWNSYYYNVM